MLFYSFKSHRLWAIKSGGRNIHNQRSRQPADLLSWSSSEPRSTVISVNDPQQTNSSESPWKVHSAHDPSLRPLAGSNKIEVQIHKVSEGTLFFYEQEIACHSLLLHYKGEGFTCDLSARKPLVCGWPENLERSRAMHGGSPGMCHTCMFWELSLSVWVCVYTSTLHLLFSLLKLHPPHGGFYKETIQFHRTQTSEIKPGRSL